ncbi:hypothetical protein [Paractinoplanes brasiliensis]|uniref:Uncharacterized protein n=1 Tax=Paractinoplanes brasiliensis TaxID=52695 RepID=A0A4R6JA33_9ACTN|nr:hypothetical protein [Actinoplanes brasiliensis]TDO32533.1 hypothetical protein C8E87_7998 [Actinoplanes brasiliensis]GID27591.1 hypothetical protein Abr02nite_25740 [Actinoplanes brasiliensis]
MFDPAAMIMADRTTKQNVLSARPDAPIRPDPPPARRRAALRHWTGSALRRLADRIEPHPAPRPCPAP